MMRTTWLIFVVLLPACGGGGLHGADLATTVDQASRVTDMAGVVADLTGVVVDLAGVDLAGSDLASSTSYSTTFPLTENPIAESGHFTTGQVAGNDLWGNVQTTPGLAFGVSEPTQYGDPSAILTGSWGADQTAQATVHIVDSSVTTGGCCHEAEVRLRNTLSSTNHTITGYEAYCSVMSDNAYCHIASWGGGNGVWVNMDANPPALYLQDGDVLKATATGSNPVTLTMYINGTQVLQVVDSGNFTFTDSAKHGPWPSGNPGIGFYDNQSDVTFADFGFSRFSASSP